jgi:hypothetical protein
VQYVTFSNNADEMNVIDFHAQRHTIGQHIIIGENKIDRMVTSQTAN